MVNDIIKILNLKGYLSITPPTNSSLYANILSTDNDTTTPVRE